MKGVNWDSPDSKYVVHELAPTAYVIEEGK